MKGLPIRFLVFVLTVFVHQVGLLWAQQAELVTPSSRWQTQKWQAHWVSPSQGSIFDYGVHLFRKAFELEGQPDRFIVHVSADQRYELFVNGTSVSRGPAGGSLGGWNYESLDIAPYLRAGTNVIAASVVNYGQWIPGAQQTLQTGFILQGESEAEWFLNTGSTWKTIQNHAYKPSLIAMEAIDIEPADEIRGDAYPWGWQYTEYSDADWQPVLVRDRGQPVGHGTEYRRALQPRQIPLPELKQEHPMVVRRSEGVVLSDHFPGDRELRIPPHSTVSLLLDQGYLTNAYVSLGVGGGKGSRISLSYAEGLYGSDGNKGNRDEIEGKALVGVTDIIYPDGVDNRMYQPLNFKTFRYIQLEIETDGDELVIRDFERLFVGYPFLQKGRFSSNDPLLSRIWDVGWRTARLCAVDMYYDCPYYERLQYTGDTRIQSLISLYVSGDDRLMRKAISDLGSSLTAEGILQSRFPTQHMQIIPPFSLYWVNMLHDYWMHRPDTSYVKDYLSTVDRIVEWYSNKIDVKTGMLGAMPHWNFVDWTEPWPWSDERPSGGVPPGGIEGGSAILSLQFAYALGDAIELMEFFGYPDRAERYRQTKKSISEAVVSNCYDDDRKLISDDIKRSSYSQHATIMAILSDALPLDEQPSAFGRILEDQTLIQATVYYQFYLIRAMKKTGLGDQYVSRLQTWENMLDMGLTTFAERPEPSRSDCHAWSASPNYDFLATVCGIMPNEPGFQSVLVKPHLGKLEEIEGKVPHPNGGFTEVQLKRNGNTLSGTITLPDGIHGVYHHQGREIKLNPGLNSIN